MSSEDIRHGGKVNRNIRCSVVRSSILWRYSVVVGSLLNEAADGCSFLRLSFLEQRLER